MKQMKRRQFLKKTIAAGAAASLPFSMSCAEDRQRPNIILIMVDDMGFSDIGCYGGEVYTPNLDKLAKGGIRFTRFYNAARCCPTRASLLTGLYPHQAGMGGMVKWPPKPGVAAAYQGYLNDNCVTIAEVLKSGGYQTLMSGKWHVGEGRPHWPTDRGFDKYFGLISGAANYFDPTRTKRPGLDRPMAHDDKRIQVGDDFYMTTAITDHAVECLEEACVKKEPFFQYVAYTAPHWPLHALPEDIKKYKGKFSEGWDSLREKRIQRMRKMGLIKEEWPLPDRDPQCPAWDEVEDKADLELKMEVYAAQIDRVDQGVGRIIETLRKNNSFENTLIFFLSDNGGCHEGGPEGGDWWDNDVPPGGVDGYKSYGRSWANLSNTPFRWFKHWVHEGGISTPLIAHWPAGIKDGGRYSHDTGHIVDIMSTCCDVAGVNYPNTFRGKPITSAEGKTLSPLFKKQSRRGHDVLCWEHMGNKAIRKGEWKLVSTKDGQWELYNLEEDRTELQDLSRTNPEKVSELLKEWKTWAKRVGV